MSESLALFGSVFAIVFVAELPDKTALAAMVLATRHRPLPVLVGAASALTVQSAVAVAAGELLSMLPQRPVHVAAGALFLVSAVFMWRRREDQPESAGRAHDVAGFWRSAWLSFAVVFVAEWGDLTQLTTAALSARYRSPYVVFAGSALALWSVATIAIFVGHRAGRLLQPSLTKKVAAAVFAVVGVVLVASALRQSS